MLQLAESCKLQQKIKILVCCSSPSAVKLQQQINILCHPTRPALSCPWFWHFYLHAKHTRGPSWMARRFRILWSSPKMEIPSQESTDLGVSGGHGQFRALQLHAKPTRTCSQEVGTTIARENQYSGVLQLAEAVNYNRKSISGCAATCQVLWIIIENQYSGVLQPPSAIKLQ